MKIDSLNLPSNVVIAHSIAQIMNAIHEKIEQYQYNNDTHILSIYFVQDFDEVYDNLFSQFTLNKGYLFDIDIKEKIVYLAVTQIMTGEKDKNITLKLISSDQVDSIGMHIAQSLYRFFDGIICAWLLYPEQFTVDHISNVIEEWVHSAFPIQLECISAFSEACIY